MNNAQPTRREMDRHSPFHKRWLTFIQQALDQVSTQPELWNILRRIVEANFQGEKAVIEVELTPLRDSNQRRVLDFGCGTGELAPCFPATHYVGIDPSTTYLRFARRIHGERFIVSDGAALALASEQFDAALIVGVLHHLPDTLVQTAMTELHRVLRPDAIILIMEDIPPPNIWNIAGHAMHWFDRGGFIRTANDYQRLFGNNFTTIRSYSMRSGICDYGVYVLRRSL